MERQYDCWFTHRILLVGTIDSEEPEHEVRVDANIPPSEKPIASVIIVTYLHEEYVAKCIEGIVAQKTEFPIEVIIGTDRSPDRTDDIVREYSNRYPEIIRPIFREHNIGATANFLDTYRYVRGKYLSICEGDDEWIDDSKLQQQVAILEKDSDTVLVFSDVDLNYVGSGKQVTNLANRLGIDSYPSDSDGWFEGILLRKIAVFTPTICARTECWTAATDEIRDVLKDAPMGDTPILLALAKRGKFAYLPKSTALMNRLPESLSRSKSYMKRAQFTLGSIGMQLAIANKYSYSSAEFSKLLSKRALTLIRFCLLDRNFNMASEMIGSLARNVHVDWRHRFLLRVSRNRLASTVYRFLDTLAIKIRRRWRKSRYGVESSI